MIQKFSENVVVAVLIAVMSGFGARSTSAATFGGNRRGGLSGRPIFLNTRMSVTPGVSTPLSIDINNLGNNSGDKTIRMMSAPEGMNSTPEPSPAPEGPDRHLQNMAEELGNSASSGSNSYEGDAQREVLQKTFDGTREPGPSAPDGLAPVVPEPADASSPDTERQWRDSYTGQWETQASKLRKALDLALSHPVAGAIKNNLPYNTLYKVDNQWSGPSYYVRTRGDDPERPGEEPVIVFPAWVIRHLSPHFIASKMAAMWVRHLVRNDVPPSAEKTYMEGSIFIRVFMDLTGSTALNWVGRLDHHDGNDSDGNPVFQTYRHFYHWVKGFVYDNVRKGIYFKDKIMHAQGDPIIDTDGRGRKTLYQRVRNQEITDQAGEQGQRKFDDFVYNEREWLRHRGH